MIRLNSKIKKLNRNGFVIIKDFFNEYQKSQLKIFKIITLKFYFKLVKK